MAKRTRAVSAATADDISEFARVRAALHKRFGAASFHKASEDSQPARIPTGVFMLDFALLGGIPHNRVSMLVGERGAGKSMLADRISAGAQAQYEDQIVAKVDVEHAHDTVWSSKLGVDPERMYIAKPETGEAAVDIADALIHTKEVSLVVVDSIAALTPMKEIESSAEDALVAAQSRLVGSMVRKCTAGLIAERNRGHQVTVLFINQFRCLDKKTLVVTPDGTVPIASLVRGSRVWAPSGWATVTEVHDSGFVPGVQVHLKYHHALRMSDNHIQPVVDGHGSLSSKYGSQLSVGDWVAISNTQPPEHGSVEMPLHEAALLGIYFAYGCIASAPGLDVSFIDKYAEGKDEDSRIPDAILRGTAQVRRVFLQHASLSTHAISRNQFLWAFETEAHVASMAALLLSFGVKADSVLSPKGEYGYLRVSGSDAVRYRDVVGFAEPRKQAAASAFVETHEGVRVGNDLVPQALVHAVMDAVDSKIPEIAALPEHSSLNAMRSAGLSGSRTELLDFVVAASRIDPSLSSWVVTLSEYRFVEIVGVESTSVDAYDIEVDGSLFFAEGVLTHNSKIGVVYGDSRSIPGGKALEYCTSVQLIIKNKELMGKNALDLEGCTVNEHAFEIKKNRMNRGPRTGEFRVIREPDEGLGLVEGDVDDASTLLAFAKKFGLYTGGGKSWTLEFWDDTHRFENAAQAVSALYADRELYWRLRNALIHAQAAELGMPDSFLETFY